MNIKHILFILLFSMMVGCSNLCEETEQERTTSPDKQIDAVLLRVDCGATTDYAYKVYIVPKGKPVNKEHPIFVADKVEGLIIEWTSSKHLEIKYKRARIFNFTNFWNSRDIDNFNYIVTIRESLVTESLQNNICSGKNATLDCLSKNFDALYSSNYSLFWDILHKGAEKALQCDSLSNTAKFLRLADVKSLNAEFNEFFSETIENLLVSNSECFLKALAAMPENEQEKIINLLRHPLFLEETEIRQVMEANKDNKKYRHIIRMYLDAD